ncbi:rect protein [Novosphingobium aromaticivorans DSM 12444]|uniref:Rect protein n=1 Tax=Novosphingobium aromaticivorans (strain ATCC 700278 / DSM 12444 / CCUG 56034 / CIP 105152 / NBRC 16084 / F199) TaxID=279238 RepID=Q2G4T8_NOVAD|nr:recombinase RecT [Novosphingobium aromaticivorans]ABD27135.1 rect protein [Novosphingobium aromaticivorans DSM 12444]SCY89194.1 recombination protein RecT [Novosphingobium aromaticivorans]
MASAARENSPVAVVKQNLTAMAPEFRAALPAHVTVEKFTRVAQTAILSNPNLMRADRASLFGSITKLAQDGLLPDGREAALVMFGQQVQAMPMIAGVLKKIRQSGEVAKISAQVVHENDHFVVSYGFDEDVTHNPPPLDKPRGKAIGAYATAVLKDGSRMLEVMSLEEIDKVRAVSRAGKSGPWVQWWGEMARKTVMRRLSKRLPMSTDLEEEVFSRDDTMTTEFRPTLIEGDAQEAPKVSRLEALEHQIEEAETVESEPLPTNEPEGRADEDYGDQYDGTGPNGETLFGGEEG